MGSVFLGLSDPNSGCGSVVVGWPGRGGGGWYPGRGRFLRSGRWECYGSLTLVFSMVIWIFMPELDHHKQFLVLLSWTEEILCSLDFRWARWLATTSRCACSMPGASRMGSRSSRPASLRTPTISRFNNIPHFVACIKSLEFERNESFFSVQYVCKIASPSFVLGLWVTGTSEISEDSGSRKQKYDPQEQRKVGNCHGLKSRRLSLESWRLLLKLGILRGGLRIEEINCKFWYKKVCFFS
jgi:hypothetical protein